jgi:hypothetical protein
MEPKALFAFDRTHWLSCYVSNETITSTMQPILQFHLHLPSPLFVCNHSRRKRPKSRDYPFPQSSFRYRSSGNFKLLMGGRERRKADAHMSPILLPLWLLLPLRGLLLGLLDHEVPRVFVARVLLPVAGEVLDRGESAVECQ